MRKVIERGNCQKNYVARDSDYTRCQKWETGLQAHSRGQAPGLSHDRCSGAGNFLSRQGGAIGRSETKSAKYMMHKINVNAESNYVNSNGKQMTDLFKKVSTNSF